MTGNDSERWAFDEDRCYHGVQGDPDINKERVSRIFVELAEWGPTERQEPVVLRELQPLDSTVSFRWNYLGNGPTAAAEAILNDALGFEPDRPLRNAFIEDFIAHCSNDFRLRRGAILRWARGLLEQKGVPTEQLPPVLGNLPPTSRREYQSRPEEYRRR